MGWTSSGMGLFRPLCIFVILTSVVCSGEEGDTDAIKNALSPVYKMTRGFVEVVQPNDLNEAEDIVDKWLDKIADGKHLFVPRLSYSSRCNM